MNYLTRIGNRLVFRLISAGILLHASFCIAAIGMVIAAPFVIQDFFQDVKLTTEMVTKPQVVSVPLVNRSDWRGDAQTSKYLCYVELPNWDIEHYNSAIRIASPYLRAHPPSGLDSLEIYSHRELIHPSGMLPRIIEVPADRSWNSVFEALRGRSFTSTIFILCFQFVLGLIVVYIAIKGYFFIKYGPRRKNH